MAKLLQKLNNLLLLNGKELELWEELKAETSKLCSPLQVMADNDHIQKLTEAVVDLIKKQNQPGQPLAPKTYAAALQTGLPPWAGPQPVREVPTRVEI